MSTAESVDVSARWELAELYARYTHAFDEGRADELAGLFTANGVFVLPGADPVRGRAALAELVRASAARGTGNRHLVSAVVLEPGPDVDSATGTAYVQVVSIGPDGPRPVVAGRYTDRFAREDGRWRIRSRTFTPFAAAAPTASADGG